MGLFDFLFSKNKNTSNSMSTNSTLSQQSSTQSINNSNNTLKSNTQLDLSKQSMLNLTKDESIQQLNLKKELIQSLCLEKKELSGLTARVAVVMDYSGSMRHLYQNGTVQAILDRLLPLAMQFDDNGEMEVWLFHNDFYRIPSLSLNNYYNYLKNERILETYSMEGTQYAPVMNDVIKKYTKEESSSLPTLVLFITDGDNFSSDKKASTSAIKKSSKHPIFWQFVGIGNSSFDYLEDLDNMTGRYVDNANFFSVNDLTQISDEELYNRLLNEYPQWISKIKELKMI